MRVSKASQPDFHIEDGIRPEHLEQAVEGYWQAFSSKLRFPLGPERRALAFLRGVVDPNHAICAVSSHGRFLGVAGYKTQDGAFIGGTFSDMAAIYGIVGATFRGLLIGALERPIEDGTLLMDGIFVSHEARGLGVGSALLDAVERKATSCGLTQVRLDVIDTNLRARHLYQRRGFQEISVQSTGILRHLFGFRSATTMIKAVGD
ncbi:GNAT family N-acetyltransferase [Notoacmeibacter marinus]|uniref:GNAT family N-acetyltransferase n=1 Tax=Notoacmeibacter marinus TaxID=1876515 RepID=UPI000DF4031F